MARQHREETIRDRRRRVSAEELEDYDDDFKEWCSEQEWMDRDEPMDDETYELYLLNNKQPLKVDFFGNIKII